MSIFFKGTSNTQDGRFSNKEKAAMKNQDWPKIYSRAIDFKKVSLLLRELGLTID